MLARLSHKILENHLRQALITIKINTDSALTLYYSSYSEPQHHLLSSLRFLTISALKVLQPIFQFQFQIDATRRWK